MGSSWERTTQLRTSSNIEQWHTLVSQMVWCQTVESQRYTNRHNLATRCGKQSQRSESRMAGPPRKSKNKPGSRPENRLKTSQLTGWQTGTQIVAVVKSTVYHLRTKHELIYQISTQSAGKYRLFRHSWPQWIVWYSHAEAPVSKAIVDGGEPSPDSRRRRTDHDKWSRRINKHTYRYIIDYVVTAAYSSVWISSETIRFHHLLAFMAVATQAINYTGNGAR